MPDPQAIQADELANSARALLERGDAVGALKTVWQALALRETPDAKAVFIGCFRRIRFSGDAPEMRGPVARAVAEGWALFEDFSAAATDLAKRAPPIAAAIARVNAAAPRLLNRDELWSAGEQAATC